MAMLFGKCCRYVLKKDRIIVPNITRAENIATPMEILVEVATLVLVSVCSSGLFIRLVVNSFLCGGRRSVH